MADFSRDKWNRKAIQARLKSAVEDLAPDVLDKVDLETPQMTAEEALSGEEYKKEWPSVAVLGPRLRVFTTLAAACLCMVLLAGGFYTRRYNQVDSVIGIDVNPSVELSVNRKNRVLEAKPLNEDASAIMSDMNLKGVDLNVAVNAVIGSMVTHGYLDDLDNAILVTVSNDSISKAASLRSSVVEDIQTTLDENQVRAVVYDQQVIEEDDIKQLADEYAISYGKAYFLKELIDQNEALTMEDMNYLAPLTMEEIAKEITEGTYAVGSNTKVREESSSKGEILASSAEPSLPDTSPESLTDTETLAETDSTAESTSPSDPAGTTGTQPPETAQPPAATQPAPETTTHEETQAPVTEGKVKVDYTDYSNGVVTVNFATKVKWKNPTVSVKDGDGSAYSAMVGDTDNTSCQIMVGGLEGGTTYTFVIGGISPKNGKPTTVKGTFDTPIFGDGEANETLERPDLPEGTEKPTEDTKPSESTQESTAPTETESVTEGTEAPETTAPSQAEPPKPPETEKPQESTAPAQTEPSKAPESAKAADGQSTAQ